MELVIVAVEVDYFRQAREMAAATRLLDLAAHPDFQNTFVKAPSF